MKEEIIREQMLADERKDRLVKQIPIPANIKCNTCGFLMEVDSYWFKQEGTHILEDTQMLFVFNCSQKHTPNRRKVVYQNGTEYVFPERKCKDCGHTFNSTKKEDNNKLIFTEVCIGCDKVEVDEYDLTFEPEEPIKEEDRKKYCTDFIGKITFMQDLEAIGKFGEWMKKHEEEKKLKEEYNLDKIEKLTIPKLEQQLVKAIEEFGFIKLEFEKPEIKRYLSVPFCVQDPTDRGEKESIKIILKVIKNLLANTNWRLMEGGASEITYRLGYITGRFKAYETDEDLMILAKGIMKSQKETRNNSLE